VIALSVVGAALFLVLFKMFKDRQPAVPYFVLIVYGIVVSFMFPVTMLHVEDADITLGIPLPDFNTLSLWVYAVGFALMLAVIDVIEQVMSNAAIEKIDPLKRKCDSNNSLKCADGFNFDETVLEKRNLFQIVFKNGTVLKKQTLSEIRRELHNDEF